MMDPATAYHEAGHCVAAHALGHQVISVSADGVYEQYRRNPNATLTRAVIALCGPMAEHRYRPITKQQRAELWQGAWKLDRDKVICADDGERVDRLAKRIVRDNWGKIELVAQVLLMRGSLTQDEVESLIG
jgi:hypothetical protein